MRSSSNSPQHPPLSKSYEPALFEKRIYDFWEKEGYFEAKDENAPGQKAFAIMIPPPNVTGALHMGHALTNTIQDILIRWRRMHQENTLWLPGTDHAGISTQVMVEKAIAKEGKNAEGRPLSRHDLGREKFVARTWQWKEEYGSTITKQLKRLGSSLDWSRERFTMDEGLSKAVREVFVRLYEEGLIYRGERIINWCTRCRTALSDLEVTPKEKKGHLWQILYKIEGEPEAAPIVIATTRPETLLGDTAVAVHPEDERYRHLHGKRVILPLLGRTIPIITDEYVDQEFGTGALKITPAHDFNDYDIGKKHQLPTISVMGKDGKITSEGGPYAGLKFTVAREKIVADLQAAGQLKSVEDHALKIGVCERCETVAEPIISKQWFVKIEPLATPAIEAVRSGKIQFYPKSWEKTYFEWMTNIRDWCISRQLWWGHQIPVWYCDRCEGMTVDRNPPKQCKNCQAPASELKQDEDVLDTWFSSGLWPFSTLGWPEKTKALETFYPNAILETGFDIIFFWVARMIMMGIHFMGDVPFHKIYLHAMVRDEKGEKMSKTKGNVIDPLVLMDQHGTDALRFTLAIMSGQGRDIKLSVDRVEGYRAFCNKLWNAVKFVHMQWDAFGSSNESATEKLQTRLSAADLEVSSLWILSKLQETIEKVEQGLKNFEMNLAAQAIYDFTWHEFCDWYIELVKFSFREGSSPQQKQGALNTLRYTLEELLKLTHPFMPFVTEELWQSLPGHENTRVGGATIMLQDYPKSISSFHNPQAVETLDQVKKVVESIRQFRGENNIATKIELSFQYSTGSGKAKEFMKTYAPLIQHLTRVKEFLETENPSGEGIIPITDLQLEFRISLDGLVDREEEKRRLKKELEKIEDDLAFVTNKLSQEKFLANAPAALVAKEKQKQQEFQIKKKDLESALARLTK